MRSTGTCAMPTSFPSCGRAAASAAANPPTRVYGASGAQIAASAPPRYKRSQKSEASYRQSARTLSIAFTGGYFSRMSFFTELTPRGSAISTALFMVAGESTKPLS